MDGHNTVHHGAENGLHQGTGVAQRLLGSILTGHIAKHQHRPHHQVARVADGRATVGNVKFTAIAGNQQGVVGQTLCRTARQRIGYRNGGRLARFFVDDAKHFIDWSPQRLGMSPPSQVFGYWVQQCDAGSCIGGNHAVANGIERYAELLLAGL